MSEVPMPWKMAELAYKAGEYEASVDYLKESFKRNKKKLDKHEMDFFGACYKKLINLYRDPLQYIENNTSKCSEIVKLALQDNKANLCHRIISICDDALNIIDSILLPSSDLQIQTLYYNKLKGDYYRYLAEVASQHDVREGHIGRARTCYETAFVSHDGEIKPSEPLYMCTCLNYSVFLAETLGLLDDAIDRLESAFSDAIKYMDELEPEDYKESTVLLQIFRDNIDIWKDERRKKVERIKS